MHNSRQRFFLCTSSLYLYYICHGGIDGLVRDSYTGNKKEDAPIRSKYMRVILLEMGPFLSGICAKSKMIWRLFSRVSAACFYSF